MSKSYHHCNRCGEDQVFVIETQMAGYPHYYCKCMCCDLWNGIFSDTKQGAIQMWRDIMEGYEDVSQFGFMAKWVAMDGE